MTQDIVTSSQRADIVWSRIVFLRDSITSGFIELGRLLKETRDNDYHLSWGFTNFGVWVEEGSGLDISTRTAYDLIKVVERAAALQIPDRTLQAVKISSLKQIMSLPSSTSPETMRELVEDARDLPFSEVREIVGALKNEAFFYHSLKFNDDVEHNVYQPALEHIRRKAGNTVDGNGDTQDISDSRAIELILADYISGIPTEDSIEEAEWSDVIEVGTEEEEQAETAHR